MPCYNKRGRFSILAALEAWGDRGFTVEGTRSRCMFLEPEEETQRLNNKAILKQGKILAIIVIVLLLPPFLNKPTTFNNHVLASLTVASCSKSTNLTANNVNSSLPQEEADPVFSGNNLYVGWAANQSTSQEVFFRASHNKGVSFGPTINLSNDPINSDTNPRIAASGANVYAVWQNFRTGQSVFLRASHDSGVTFGKKINISNGSGTFLQLTNTDLWLPQVLTSGKNVYVAWAESLPGKLPDIYFRASHDSGVTFGPRVNISHDSAVSREPYMAIYASNVFIAWASFGIGKKIDVFFRASHNGGASFLPIKDLSADSGDSREPILATASKDNLYIIWRDDTTRNYEIYFRASHDNGTTFAPVKNLSKNPGVSREAAVTASGSNVYALWRDNTPGNYDVFFRASHDGGRTFAGIVDLSGRSGIRKLSGSTDRAQLAASGNYVFAVWDKKVLGNFEVFLSASTDYGRSFLPAVNLSNDSGTSNAQLVAAYGSTANAIWLDDTNQTQLFGVYSSFCSL